jgi:hypothetical protein
MHQVDKLQSYFRLCPNKPHLEEAYLPLPFSKYILIFNDSSVQSNEYNYFTDVVEYLHTADPSLNIVQAINGPNCEHIPHAYHVQQLSHSNLYFLVKNSDLVISSEHFCTELCGIYDKPLIRLSGNSFDGPSKPFFNNPSLHSIFCTEEQPSLAAVEEKKAINKIPPERIARATLKKLNIKDPTPLYKTLYTGPLYRQYLLDCIPDFKLERNISGDQPISARLDIENDIPNLLEICTHSNVHTLCIDREVDIQDIFPHQNKIKSIVIEINLDFSVGFVREIHKVGCEVTLYTQDSKNLNQLRLKFIDWVVRLVPSKTKPDLPKSKKLFYKSTKITFSKNKKFTSLAARNANSDNNKIIDNEAFWKESDHFLIYSLD